MNTQSIIERPKAGGSNSGAKSRGFLTLLCVLVLASSCVSQQVVEERKTSALLLLEESAEWLVAEGIGKYYANGGDFSVIYEPLAEKGVGFYFRDVAVHPDMFLAWIALEKGSITKDILCYARFEHMGTIYEYWEITQGSRRPDFDKRYIRFLVTQADSLTSPRKVIHESDQFFSEWAVSEEVTIRFPLHQLGSINAMTPWELPGSHFEGTELEGIRRADVDRMNILDWYLFEDLNSEKRRKAVISFLGEFFKEAEKKEYWPIRKKLGGEKPWGDISKLYHWKRFRPVEKIEIRQAKALAIDPVKYEPGKFYYDTGAIYAEVTLTVTSEGSEPIDHDYFFILEETDELQFEVVEMKEYGHPLVFENWSWGNPTQ